MPSRQTRGSSSKVSVRSYETAQQLLQQFVAEGKTFTESLKSKPEAEITETDYQQGDLCMRKIEGASNQAFTSHVSEVWRFGTLSHTDPALARYHCLAEYASDAAKGFRKGTIPNLDFMSTLEIDESKVISSLNSLMSRRVSSDSNGMANLVLKALSTVTKGRKLDDNEKATRQKLVDQLTAAMSQTRAGMEEYTAAASSAGFRPAQDSEFSRGPGGPAGSARGDVIG